MLCISGYYGGEDGDIVLGSKAVESRWYIKTFHRNKRLNL
jgi:hypothetical protein